MGWTGVDLIEHRPLAEASRIKRIRVEEILEDPYNLSLQGQVLGVAHGAVRFSASQADVDVGRRPRGDSAYLKGVDTVACQQVVDADSGMEHSETMVGDDKDVPVGVSSLIAADGIDNGLDSLIRDLVGFFHIVLITGHLGGILSLIDGCRVREIG